MSTTVTGAWLVYDGYGDVCVPAHMGTPRSDQLQGTAVERLVELACRVCYDSLGVGRSSADLHKHILEVGHLSVLRHAVMRIGFPVYLQGSEHALRVVLSRPGVVVHRAFPQLEDHVVADINLHAAAEWDYWSRQLCPDSAVNDANSVGRAVLRRAYEVAPQLFPEVSCGGAWSTLDQSTSGLGAVCSDWVSIFMVGSRGFSHEQVRHDYECAVSQRSTRYVDESESPWIMHPLLCSYLESDKGSRDDLLRDKIRRAAFHGRDAYEGIVNRLMPWIQSQCPGVDVLTARKQARGAARGFLGNGLYTEMIFSANVRQWRWMLDNRGSRFADAEIRRIYVGNNDDEPSVLSALRHSRLGAEFNDYECAPSPDGIGRVLVRRTHSGVVSLPEVPKR